MKFRNFLESSIGSLAKVKILRYLLAENMPASEREIARLLDLSPMTVNRVMKDFCDMHLISQSVIGGSNLWKLNKESWAYKALEKIKHIETDPLKALKSELVFEDYNMVLEAYIFGSVAEGREESGSDIDVLLIVKDNQSKDHPGLRKYLECLEEKCLVLFGNKLSPLLLTKRESEQESHSKLIKKAKEGIKIK